MEDENERIKEVKHLKTLSGEGAFTRCQRRPYPDLFPRSIYCGTYNYFGIESFLSFLRERRTWVEVL